MTPKTPLREALDKFFEVSGRYPPIVQQPVDEAWRALRAAHEATEVEWRFTMAAGTEIDDVSNFTGSVSWDMTPTRKGEYDLILKALARKGVTVELEPTNEEGPMDGQQTAPLERAKAAVARSDGEGGNTQELRELRTAVSALIEEAEHSHELAAQARHRRRS